jgi:HD superfamily phosphohydrolase YqeK
VLYCADYLEPGRAFRREWRAALAERFPDDSAGVLLEVAGDRLTHLIGSGRPLIDPTVVFWNSLVAPSDSP